MGVVAQGFFCSTEGIIQHIFQSLLADITNDVGVSFIIIRFLHNKLIYGLILSFRCYLQFFDPYVFAVTTTSFIVPLIYMGLFKLAKNKFFLLVILLFPLFIILLLRRIIPDFYPILKIYYILIALYGLLTFLAIRINR